MKKLLILALVALVAGSAFAATDAQFSGNFDYSIQFDFTSDTIAGDDNAGTADLNLNAVIDDFNTVTVELSADGGAALTLDEYSLTTDLLGALGVTDSPVSLSITWGSVSLQAEEYQGVAGYEDSSFTTETSASIGMKLVIGIADVVNIVTLVAPESYFGAAGWTTPSGLVNAVYGVDVQFVQLVEGLDFNLYFVGDAAEITNGWETGMSLGYTAGDLSIGAAAQYAGAFGFGVSAAYTIADALTVGVGFAVADVTAFSAAKVGLNLTWMVLDAMDIYGAVNMDFGFAVAFDAGVIFRLGAVTYTLGYEYGVSEFNAPDAGVEGLFFKVAAEY